MIHLFKEVIAPSLWLLSQWFPNICLQTNFDIFHKAPFIEMKSLSYIEGYFMSAFLVS
jgi:hypothetical protein